MEVTLFYYSACMQSTERLVIGVCITIRDGHADAAMSVEKCDGAMKKKQITPKIAFFDPNFTFCVPKAHKSEWVKNGDFFYYLMRLIATLGASCRHDSALRKTGAWPSLITMPKRKQKGLMNVI